MLFRSRGYEDERKPGRRRLGSLPEWASKEQVRKCNRCGNMFTMLTAFQKYCSESCRADALRADHPPVPCKFCGKVFIAKLLHQSYCSLKCWAANNCQRIKAKSKVVNLKRKYGLTLDDYHRLVDDQSGRCAICGSPPRCKSRNDKELHVDHDHTTKKRRGLLCMQCNLGLGYFFDNAESLKNAALYIEKYSSKGGIHDPEVHSLCEA